jgi:hypothetical protein
LVVYVTLSDSFIELNRDNSVVDNLDVQGVVIALGRYLGLLREGLSRGS